MRRGFTLIEIVFASFMLAVVLAGLTGSFLNTRRVQGHAVVQSSMKVAGQTAIKKIYKELSQCRKLLASQTTDASSKDLGREYFLLLQGRHANQIPAGNLQFPRVDANGGLGLPGTDSGELEQSTVGNTLLFATLGPERRLSTPGVSYLQGINPKLMSNQPYILSTVKFVCYYLVDLPIPAPTIAGGRNTVQQLVRWESKPYVEVGEFKNLIAKFPLPSPNTAFTKAVYDDLTSGPDAIAGLWEPSSATAAAALYKVDAASGLVAAMPSGTAVQKRREVLAADTKLDPYASGFVSFNTTNPNVFKLEEGGTRVPVPAFAMTDTAHANFPYGFEVAIVGPSGARSVLVRLVLAARLNQGLNMYGQSQQEVIKVFDM